MRDEARGSAGQSQNRLNPSLVHAFAFVRAAFTHLARNPRALPTRTDALAGAILKNLNKSAESEPRQRLACAVLNALDRSKWSGGQMKRIMKQHDREREREGRSGFVVWIGVVIGWIAIMTFAAHYFPQANWNWFSIWPAALVWGSFLTHAKEVGDTLPQRRWLPALLRTSHRRRS
jgi:hypothetical protein